jgi:AraC-like DNA-binding protein
VKNQPCTAGQLVNLVLAFIQKLTVPYFMQRFAIKELVLLQENECFSVKTSELRLPEIPPHFHSEYELNILENAAGARRIVGQHLGEIAGREMILIGPGLTHSWQKHHCQSDKVVETTLHIHAHLFSEEFMQRNQMKTIKVLLANAAKGVCFPEKIIVEVLPLLDALKRTAGFESLLLLMRVLHILSVEPAATLLSSGIRQSTFHLPDTRVERVLNYFHQHFSSPISLKEASRIANMTEVSFSRFFKQRTGRTFVECLNEIRIDYACRTLAETTNSIAEIAFSSGFNNISHFNRIFKYKKNLTPKQYREVFAVENVYKMCS